MPTIAELRNKISLAKEILLNKLYSGELTAKRFIPLSQWKKDLDLWDEQQALIFLRPIAGLTPVIEKTTGQITGFLVTDPNSAIVHLEGREIKKSGSKTPEEVAAGIMHDPKLKEQLKERFGSAEFTKSNMLILFREIYGFEISDLSKVTDKLIGSGLIIEIPNKDKRFRRLKLNF